LLWSGYTQRLATMVNTEADPTGSAQARWQDTVAAIGYVSENPVIGAGIGQDILALNEVRGLSWLGPQRVLAIRGGPRAPRRHPLRRAARVLRLGGLCGAVGLGRDLRRSPPGRIAWSRSWRRRASPAGYHFSLLHRRPRGLAPLIASRSGRAAGPDRGGMMAVEPCLPPRSRCRHGRGAEAPAPFVTFAIGGRRQVVTLASARRLAVHLHLPAAHRRVVRPTSSARAAGRVHHQPLNGRAFLERLRFAAYLRRNRSRPAPTASSQRLAIATAPARTPSSSHRSGTWACT
jgi:hypothetical protein